MDLQALSLSIIEAVSAGQPANIPSKDGLLWLLAHFIALNRSVPASQTPSFLEALHIQLSLVGNDIRTRSSIYEENNDDDDDEISGKSAEEVKGVRQLPQYVTSQLEFLVNEDGISALLGKLTSYVAALVLDSINC